jgi:molecular chaperone DnaJ
MASRDWVEKDFYEILGLTRNASKDDIKKAYRKLAQQYHPDANKGDAAAETRFKEISEAYSILSNDEKRAEYDEMRRLYEAGGSRFYGFTPGGGNRNVRVNIGDIGDLFGDESPFGDIFSGMGFRPQTPRGADVNTQVTLDFDDAVAGATMTLDNGTKVRIPAGVKNGARIRVPGKGRPAPNGGEAGDLYVRVHVRDHPIFSSEGNGNLRVVAPITYPEATLGGKIEVPTLDGSVTVKVPAGTTTGRILRVKGRGAPKPGGGKGDLLVQIEVEVPRRLSKKEKEALEAFAEAHKATPREHLDRYITDHAPKAAS